MLKKIIILCAILLLTSCGSTRRVPQQQDFVPLHPPVVVPHTWQEAVND